MKATVLTATRAKSADAAALDLLVGPGDGVTGYKRLDVAVSRTSAGGLHIDVEVGQGGPRCIEEGAPSGRVEGGGRTSR
jgi:hypothetical protein